MTVHFQNYRGLIKVGWIVVIPAWLVVLFASACTNPTDWLIGVQSISPKDLHAWLQNESPPVILDMSSKEAFRQHHIPGARRVEPKSLDETIESLGIDCADSLVFVCQHGQSSILAAATARGHGFHKVYSLSGGTLGWIQAGFQTVQGAVGKEIEPASKNPTVVLKRFEQAISLISGLVIKPIYMLLTLILIAYLSRQKEKSLDLTLIRLGLWGFFTGEALCALNYIYFSGNNFPLETLHGMGMVVMGALVFRGLFWMLDNRMLGYSSLQKSCSLKRFCKRCWKQDDVLCLIQKILVFTTPSLAIVSLMPYTAPLRSHYSVSLVFDTPVVFSYTLDLQLIELRMYPLIAFFLLSASSILSWRSFRNHHSRLLYLFSAGLGCITFSWFRLFLLETYRSAPIWADFWEEVTEFIFIFGLGLWLYHHRSVFNLPDIDLRSRDKITPTNQ